MKVIKKEDYKVPVFSWCPIIEEAAFKQIDNMARLPFITIPPAIMRDCHPGFGVPIGSVMACDDTVIPNAVGVN